MKGPPKWGFGGDFGGRVEDIWWESTSILRIARFQTSLVEIGPDLTRHVVSFCMGIAICHRRKFGQVWGSPAPLSEAAGKLRSRKASLWTFYYHTENSESLCDVTTVL